MLEEVEKKAVNFKADVKTRRTAADAECIDSSDSDSDFVEVTPKNDYEAEVRAEDAQGTALSSRSDPGPQPGTSGLQRTATGSTWELTQGEAADPTTFAATLAKLKV